MAQYSIWVLEYAYSMFSLRAPCFMAPTTRGFSSFPIATR